MSECKYCKKESYGRPFCVDCGKKYFGFEAPLTIESTSTTKKAKTQKTTNKTQKVKNNNIQTIKNKIKQSTDLNNKSYDSIFDSKELKKYNLPNKNPAYALAPFQEYRIYKCKNGNMVRSKSERAISDFLTEHQIEHAYEKALKTNNKEYPYLHPDFYIPGIITHTGRKIYHIFIEHLGGPNTKDTNKIKKYWENNERKFKLYEQMNLTVLCTYEDDMINPNKNLKQKLLNIKENQINY